MREFREAWADSFRHTQGHSHSELYKDGGPGPLNIWRDSENVCVGEEGLVFGAFQMFCNIQESKFEESSSIGGRKIGNNDKA